MCHRPFLSESSQQSARWHWQGIGACPMQSIIALGRILSCEIPHPPVWLLLSSCRSRRWKCWHWGKDTLTNGEDASSNITAWWSHDRKVHINDKKSLPEVGVDPMLLTFKVSLLACFWGKHDRTHGHLLSRQGGRPLHHWCYAVLVEDLEYDRELDKNELSLQEKHTLSF